MSRRLSLWAATVIGLSSVPASAEPSGPSQAALTHLDGLRADAPDLPESSAEAPPSMALQLVVTDEALWLEGERLVTLVSVDGQPALPDGPLRGALLVPLFDALWKARGSYEVLQVLRTGSADGTPTLVIAADADLPFAVLRSVMYTAGQAQVGAFEMVVHNPWLETRTVVEFSLPSIGLPRTFEDPDLPPPLNLSVVITDRGLTLLGDDGVLSRGGFPEHQDDADPPQLPCASNGPCTGVEDYPWGQLSEALGLIKIDHPDADRVTLMPDRNVTHEVIVRAADVCRWAPLPPGPELGVSTHTSWQQSRQGLFERPVLAGGAP